MIIRRNNNYSLIIDTMSFFFNTIESIALYYAETKIKDGVMHPSFANVDLSKALASSIISVYIIRNIIHEGKFLNQTIFR